MMTSSFVSSSMSLASLSGGIVLAMDGAWATDVGRGEKHRLDVVEILLFLHALHQHRTDHAAPTDQTYPFHRLLIPSKVGRLRY